MSIILKNSKQYNINLAKQRELRAAGYKSIALNGRWGLWQENLYKKLKKLFI